MARAYSLAHLKHMYITPLQEAWQNSQVIHYCPSMEPVVKAYRKYYADTGEAVVVSMDEREERFLGDSTLTYGETRWTSFIKVLEHLKLTPEDLFIDLGCGAGFLCMLVNQVVGCKVEGYDIIHRFIENGNQIVKALELQDIEFLNQDFLNSDLSRGTAFYITCTCFPKEYMQKLSGKLKYSRPGTQFVTITRPLEGEAFQIREKLKLRFSWGTDDAYLQFRR
ncbi:hypothetical protein COW36_21385 [bacterium (Candidatus Blackallbacteria) CG17_big_fil_post_rev_8_21_14_2_50_48_46]|uniref:Histone-lysine N-methyltransferase, H3 lysine-79 specific n=1 Tax=bacterium (Candidatus Blackallbacteria) CG17_big_fil_post_rev_8_21_14_2_50_48_46 TaxID=2014261 RepID=A0A2M7FZ87_9BACT|nr:MAG: hypothetical protein COW64_14685 [bacterium (Candidatus Blackallbacteria) CG18_big_fil_WC_8_21_14_2_50_49_26]PIW14592.1 MAG: hypothetical protein COW36_21385 [bacterium (Candidatus Blackallbacteria) CG17_big_fil_post_rev_8_21_14_2_50_48_46]PIW45643.1 MAG: hypothetical protein COW20_19215 [bacterium (Candidatus Blackallbacteria) CG13_big_fil_rev_8_21_14_2_50_49_14]